MFDVIKIILQLLSCTISKHVHVFKLVILVHLLVEILSAFDALDVNKDGSISKKEMKDAARMTGMNPTDKEIEEWWKAADTNGRGLYTGCSNRQTKL